MARYHGKKSVVYLSTTGSGNAVNVSNLTSWSIDRKVDRVDMTAFGDLNKVYGQGLPDVQGAFDGFFDDAATAALFTGADSTDGVKFYLYPSSDATARYFYGTAWLDVSINSSVSDAVKISATFAAAGASGYKLA